MKEYHEILGLEEGASQEEIQVAYENLSNKLNPNNNNNDEFFVEKYNKVQKAYKVLNNSSILGDKSYKSIPSDKTPISATNLKSTKQSNRSNMKVFIKIFILIAFLTAIFLAYYEFMMTDKYSLSYNKSKSEWFASEIYNEIVYVKNTMAPFTGKLNKLKNNYSGKFISGKKSGIHKEFNRKGRLIYEGEYKDGEPIGLHRKWSENGAQLIVKVNYKEGKRHGLCKIWDENGNLIKLDFNENEIVQYLKDYFASSTNLDIIEGNYSTRGIIPYYEFSIIKIYDKYYAVMTNSFTNERSTTISKQFLVGDVKAIFTKYEEPNKYIFDWFMADKRINLNNTVKYDISSNSLLFKKDFGPIYYKGRF